ncbi:pantoate--beta-alanine ligase [Aliiruegeria sabulilitoris]|uniref:pantoate--beta-alanine ligase n=1 Tax=Aliiruegeria sabulilitoris TaxID=1510458 RepID=UPI000835740E|nr:pantoate--beta-alanine ligase [Aliiruegeria sabulilitoris]NDR59336.1 pantoate--beta-alanine ligase [Pseudoruegeria sp. M32A2M]
MEICRTSAELRSHIAWLRRQGLSIGLVPTMGYLHAGHMALVERAARDADRVVVSIFVNPTQFGDPADLEKYPRDTERDLAMLREAGVEAVFLPSVEVVYPEGSETIVETMRLANVLHGEVREGHFRGVATVVAKLFNLVQPDLACFGEKDYQQLQVIRQMVRDLHFPLEIIGCPTVREADGLAMSSRNVRLSPEDRAAALVLNRSLDRAEALCAAGATVEEITAEVATMIQSEPRSHLRAVDVTEAVSLRPVSGKPSGPLALMISAEFGGVLLIDQIEVTP